MVDNDVNFFGIPNTIMKFYNEVFELYEIRERIGELKGIQFIVHTNETNHNIPHVHAKFDKYEISISLNDFSILAGNIPNKNKNIAVKWVKENKDYILKYLNGDSMKKIYFLFLLIVFMCSFSFVKAGTEKNELRLLGKVIYVDAGHPEYSYTQDNEK